MIANHKLQAILMEKGNKSINTKTKSNIENIIIKTTKSVELLGITIDKKKMQKSIFTV